MYAMCVHEPMEIRGAVRFPGPGVPEGLSQHLGSLREE